MRKYGLSSLYLIYLHLTVCGQENFKRSTETIWPIPVNIGVLVGKYDSKLIMMGSGDIFQNQYSFYGITEFSEQRTENLTFKLPLEKSNWTDGFLEIEKAYNEFYAYRLGYLNQDYSIYYQNLWLQHQGKDYFLDSIYNADKPIHSSFSDDGRYLLINTLSTYYDYYNPEQDNRIMVYDLNNIDQGQINKDYIPCIHCADSYLVRDQLFFTIGERDGYGGFSNKNIYVAPWGSLTDTVKIAENTDIMAISSDGRFILGTRFWDRQKTTAVIIDVESRKYQMLLGRDYGKMRAFYSEREKKFAFQFRNHLIYIDLPGTFPFDALKWKNEEIPDWTEEEFWKQFDHPPLSDN